MLKKHSQLFEGLFTVTDLLVVSSAWLASYWLRFYSNIFSLEKGVPLFSDYAKMLIFVWFIWAFVYRRMGLYKPMRGVSSRLTEIWLLIRANAFAVVLLVAMTYIFREKSVPFSRLVFILFWVFSTTFSIVSRSIIRAGLRLMRRKGYNLRYILIVGAGSLARSVATRILQHPEYGFELVGCLSSAATSSYPVRTQAGSFSTALPKMQGEVEFECIDYDPKLESKIVGSYGDLPLFIERGGIDQIIVALPLADHDKLMQIMTDIGDAVVDVKIVPDVHDFIQLGSLIEEFDGLPVVSLASTPLAGFSSAIKRIFDVFVTVFAIVLFAPFMFLIALLIKLTSPGPIFYSQERVGLDGKSFTIYKLRTMRVDAEKAGATFATRNDPRTTWIGKILRRTSLDELPQLFNVLLGHMSLVGPRPERPVFIEEFRKRIPKYMLRHKVQAGMTGWAQVNGWRGNTSIEKRIEHDLYYIEHWSLFLDIKILLLTIVNGFKNKNAY